MDPHTFLRRLRGLAGITAVWACAWTAIGALVGVAFWVRGDELHAYVGPFWLIPTSLAGLFYGVCTGLAFGVAVAASERRRTADDVSMLRVGLAGACSAAAMAWFLFHAMAPGVVCAALGFGCGAAAAGLSRSALSRGDGAVKSFPPAT
jgi:hypothetical protein